MTYQDKLWKRAIALQNKFEGLDYAVVDRASTTFPGVPYNTPVKILSISCLNSTMYPGCPYLSVSVELPNGEQRTLAGESLCEGKNAEKKFKVFKRAYSL
jgi:hypothetical protein